MRDSGPINPDVVFIVESKELLSDELHAIIHADGVWDSKAMDDVEEEQHGLFEFDHGDRPSFYPLGKLVYGDKQLGVAPMRFFEWSNQIKPPDHQRPGDGNCLEHFGR